MPTYKFTVDKPITVCGECPCSGFELEYGEWAGNCCDITHKSVNIHSRPADCPLQEVRE